MFGSHHRLDQLDSKGWFRVIVLRPDLSDIGQCPPGANRCQFHWCPCKDEEKSPKLKVEEMHQKLPENKNLFLFHLVVGLASSMKNFNFVPETCYYK